jgi:hypothetical protein
MTYAMWGIVIGMLMMFGFSLLRYGHSRVREQETRGAVGQRQRPDDSH